MSPERFQDLADAYGGDLARWPADVRDAAQAFVAVHGAQAAAMLADAEGLDALLAAARPAAASPALVERIVASAPQARSVGRALRWLLPAGVSAGLAAASVAGLITGVRLSHAAAEADAAYTTIAADDAGIDLGEDA